jgi:glycosyltransferase A (GT-A) superfamily protein (DUF2064 family)
LFAKEPFAGLAKTRLAATVGPVAAAEVARALLDDALEAVSEAALVRPVLSVPGEVATAPWAGVDWPVVVQGDGDLGQRIERSLRAAGLPALAIGADTLGMDPVAVTQAAAALRPGVAVLGLAEDGGFWLLGLWSCPEGLLQDLPWSASTTAQAVRARLVEAGFEVLPASAGRDVDVWDDLVAAAGSPSGHAPRTIAIARELVAASAGALR